MAKKNYRDIARKKVEKKAKKTYKPKTGGRKVQVQSSSGKKGASLGYAIFILICVIGGVAAFVALGDNQEEDEYLAPRIDEENVADSDYTGPTTTPETGIQTGDSV